MKWNVTSLSPVGPIIQKTGSVEHHGVVLVYKQLGSDPNNYSFHVYLATNSASDIKVSTMHLYVNQSSLVQNLRLFVGVLADRSFTVLMKGCSTLISMKVCLTELHSGFFGSEISFLFDTLPVHGNLKLTLLLTVELPFQQFVVHSRLYMRRFFNF